MDILKFVEVGYRALEHREEIEYVAGRLEPYVDMLKADADLVPRITRLVNELFPKPGSPQPTYDVRWAQRSLNSLGIPTPPLAVDGVYGERTREAVASFQTQHGLTPDGWLGPKTIAVLHVLSGG